LVNNDRQWQYTHRGPRTIPPHHTWVEVHETTFSPADPATRSLHELTLHTEHNMLLLKTFRNNQTQNRNGLRQF